MNCRARRDVTDKCCARQGHLYRMDYGREVPEQLMAPRGHAIDVPRSAACTHGACGAREHRTAFELALGWVVRVRPDICAGSAAANG